MKKTILITGARDIGSEICRFFIKNNYKVIELTTKNKATDRPCRKSLEVIFLIINQCDLSDF